MRTVDPVPGILPTSDQELFLRATLLDDQESMDRWIAMVDSESLDPSTLRLLPLLHPKLHSFRVPPRLHKKVEEAYGQTRVKNHLLFQDLQRLLMKFESNKIPTLLLKGSALIPRYYKDHGLRPMNDLDILIPNERAVEAIELLKTIGY